MPPSSPGPTITAVMPTHARTHLRSLSMGICLLALGLTSHAAAAHSPSVSEMDGASPQDAIVLEDPTLSRAIGATIAVPGELDWYRMDLQAGEPLVVGMTAPDATGALAATFTLVGPGLPPAQESGLGAMALAEAAGVDGALQFQPAPEPRREVHGGLGFVNFGNLAIEAPETGSYWVAVYAVDPDATGKYVLAPGVREEFGLDAVAGMLDLIDFFLAPWPPEPVRA
jgi:hypothetical protein